MFKNHVKIAWRNLKKKKGSTLINIAGLSIGLCCVIVIFTFVKYQLSFDMFHSNTDRIYRIVTEFHQEDIIYTPGVPSPLGKAIQNDLTFAEEVAMVASLPERLVSIPSDGDDIKFKEVIAFAEPSFFEIMNFPLEQGNKNGILREPNTAIITRRIAKKYFGNGNPMGRTINVDDRLKFVVTGVLKDLPPNTDRREEIYLSYFNLKEHSPGLDEEGWWFSTNKGRQCFVLLRPGITDTQLEMGLSQLIDKNYDEEQSKIWQFVPQPISDVHFNTDTGGFIQKKYIWALAFIGLFLLVTTCVNFVNLSTAQALGRAKEIGVRKVLGGVRSQLFWQFMVETALISLIAMGFAIVMAYFMVSYINPLFGTEISLGIFQDPHLFSFLSVLLLAVIFFSGFYPGLVLSRFKPISAISGKLTNKQSGNFSLKKVLVVTQFVISQLLIISVLVIANQMRYAQKADLGFDKDAIVILPEPEMENLTTDVTRERLSQIPGVESLTFCSNAPVAESNPNTGIVFDSRTEPEDFFIYLKAGDHKYATTFGLDIIEGRNLFPSDTIREYLLNETAVRKLGFLSNTDVLGKTASINSVKGTIVGIIKDFHNNSFHAAIDPIYITTQSNNYSKVAVKINLTDLNSTLTSLEEAWKELDTRNIFEYQFLDDQIARFYKVDNMILKLIQFFTLIAIIIGCLGLLGLISFMAVNRTKEVGVRKVLGASIGEILWLFGKEFIKLLLFAFVIAAPLAWMAMDNWLENFAYRTVLSWWLFAIALVIMLVIALLTVSWKSFRAASVNPVDVLRSE